MKKLLLILFLVPIQILNAQNWGEKVDYDTETKYDVYAKTYYYSDKPFLITDIRSDTLYSSIESFNIKNLTVYRPFDGNEFLSRRPVVFFVHGGGWIDGYSFWYRFASQSMAAEKGYIFVSTDYRLTSDSVFIADEYCPDRAHCTDAGHRTKAAWYPDNILDVRDAFAWVTRSIDSLGGDTNNIFIFGHSAGGHLVSLLATSGDYASLRPHIRGVISLSGAYQIKTMDMTLFGSAIDQTFHGGHENNDAELDAASPMTYITSGLTLPVFQLLHCSMDLPSLPEQRILFTYQLDYYNYYNENVFFNGYSHVSEMTAIEDINSEPSQRITQFIDGHLYPTGIEENRVNNGFVLDLPMPNPAGTHTKITFLLKSSSSVSIKLTDISGRCVKQVYNGNPQTGTHTLDLPLTDIPSGIYFIKMKADDGVKIQKLIVNHSVNF